eukprot:jgi/Picre1/29500/NNA_004886.t1
MLDASTGTLNGVIVRNNTVANTGAGINLFGSAMTLSKSSVIENHSTVFGGGVLVTSSNLTVTESEFIKNSAGKAGAAIKVLGGVAYVNASKIANNYANEYGAAFDITTRVPCPPRRPMSSRGGAIWCRSSVPAKFENSYFGENRGREGGAIYATYSCKLHITSSQFHRNGAAEVGGAILAGEGTELVIRSSAFVENGWSSCDRRQIPLKGGAIVIAQKEYILEGSCSSSAVTKNATMEILTVHSCQILHSIQVAPYSWNPANYTSIGLALREILLAIQVSGED